LAETLHDAGAEVEQIVVYQSRDVTEPNREIQAALAAGRIHWITVTSSAIARSLVQLFGQDLNRAKLVSISPITSATLAEMGFTPAAEAKEYTMPGVVQALLAAVGEPG
jgi:uroporphyrinogen III methyltransferase/synthase